MIRERVAGVPDASTRAFILQSQVDKTQDGGSDVEQLHLYQSFISELYLQDSNVIAYKETSQAMTK